MKCWICSRLKMEGRIPTPRDADYVVAGFSVCRFHEYEILVGPPLSALERCRNQLRDWWDKAKASHGEWNYSKQKFKDGSELPEFYWEKGPLGGSLG